VKELHVDPLPEGASREGALYPDGAHLTDLKEVRGLLYKMQRPAIAPSVSLLHILACHSSSAPRISWFTRTIGILHPFHPERCLISDFLIYLGARTTFSSFTTVVSFTLLLALSHLTRYALSTSAISQRRMSLLDQRRRMLRNMLEPLAGFKVGPILFVLGVPLRTLFFLPPR